MLARTSSTHTGASAHRPAEANILSRISLKTSRGLLRYVAGSSSSARLALSRTFTLLARHVRHRLSDEPFFAETNLFNKESSPAHVAIHATESPLYLLSMYRFRTMDSGGLAETSAFKTPARHFLLFRSCAPLQSVQSTSSWSPSSSRYECAHACSGALVGASFFVGPWRRLTTKMRRQGHLYNRCSRTLQVACCTHVV